MCSLSQFIQFFKFVSRIADSLFSSVIFLLVTFGASRYLLLILQFVYMYTRSVEQFHIQSRDSQPARLEVTVPPSWSFSSSAEICLPESPRHAWYTASAFPSLLRLSYQIGRHYSCVNRENTTTGKNNRKRTIESGDNGELKQ